MSHPPSIIFRSVLVWTKTIVLILVWFPFLCIVRLLDRTKPRMHTGYWFRALGRAMTGANSFWKLDITGPDTLPEKRSYVVVSNHQSLADIPIISSAKWEMKWVAKTELFRIPFIGWMMKLAGDIELKRGDRRSGAIMLLKAKEYLQDGCPVMFFPEGTRSVDGKIGAFTTGAFQLAIRTEAPVLPIAIDGSHACLPKKSWIFGEPATIRVRIFPPIQTSGMATEGAEALRDRVRDLLVQQVHEWRSRSSC